MSGNQADRRDYDVAASQSAQDNFTRVASQLEALIDQRDADVRAAMIDYRAHGVSDDYLSKELRWKNAAVEVKQIIQTLRSALASNDETARATLRRAQTAVDNIG
jgi:hypothetical protein